MRSVVLVLVLSLVASASIGACDSRRPRGHLELIPAAPTGELTGYLVSETARAKKDGKHLGVYVGATWCEPCRAFHEAAEAGQLDEVLGDLRLVVFDLDRDKARLDEAGYRSALVPLFAVPGPDGRASGQQTDGVNKAGQGPVRQLVPRIRALFPEE